MAFWRRSRGRHALGAAVTSIPAAPPVRPAPVLPSPLPAAPPPAAVVPPLDWSFPELTAPPAPEPRGPRVELTFRDGTSASLDASQARALDEIAQLLTGRDGVK